MTPIPRPLYHFTPPHMWLNDPNGLVYFQGEYHLFYQYHPASTVWGPMHWGHAVSRDLVHWEHLPVALYPDETGMIFSGSAVVDWNNTSGFGVNHEPPLIAIYTQHGLEQTQHLAYSTDRGRTWTKYAGNPLIAIGSTEFRDPKVFWHAASGQWIMITVLADRHQIRLDGSPNLKDWTHLSDFGPAGQTGGLWECPDLFQLPVAGQPGQQKWVLKVDVQNCPAQALIGEFDGRQFLSDQPLTEFIQLDYGPDFYAAQSWSDTPDGRRLWLGWVNNWGYARDIPTGEWRGLFSIPREVILKAGPQGWYLSQEPVAELQTLRGAHFHGAGSDLAALNAQLAAQAWGPAHEISVEFTPEAGSEFGIKVRVGPGEATLIGCDPTSVFIDRCQSGDQTFSAQFAARHSAPLPPGAEKIRLHLFVDTCSVEVLVNDGRLALTSLVFPSAESTGIELYGRPAWVELDVWKLQ